MRNVCLWALLVLAPAFSQGLEAVPDSVIADFRRSLLAFDTVDLTNTSGIDARVDSITIRLLDGGANPKPADFNACKACPPDSIMRYNYDGWLYGAPESNSLRYLRDSLFLIQDRNGVPVTLSLGPGASLPFALYIPVNCAWCGRMPSFPGATRYAFTFISTTGGRAVLDVQINRPTGVAGPKSASSMPSPAKSDTGAERDAAGRRNSSSAPVIRFRKPPG